MDALYRNARDPESLINLSSLYIDEAKWDSAGTLLGNFVSDPIISAEQKYMIAQFMYVRHQQDLKIFNFKVKLLESSRSIHQK